MEPPLDGVIHALKYAGREELARPLGRLLAARISGLPAGALVTAVPLHRTRFRDRGYNQARALAVVAGGIWGIPGVDVLSRDRATRAQARLPEADRPANVAGAFRVARPGLVRGRIWILVDDVTTSGSTLAAASATLEAAGARRVIPVAMALA
jgi:predicted amidophosphoribosyltransferase